MNPEEARLTKIVLDYLYIVLVCFTDDFGYPVAGDVAGFKPGSEAHPDDPVPTVYVQLEKIEAATKASKFSAKIWTNGNAEDRRLKARTVLDALQNSVHFDPESRHPQGFFRQGEHPDEIGAQIGLLVLNS